MNAISQQPTVDAMLNLSQVCKLVLYSPSQIYRLIANGSFPDRVRLGPARVGWRTSDIAAWLASRRPGSEAALSSSAEVQS
jgi:predicted DNA-binding transcriptional regulator AlpA